MVSKSIYFSDDVTYSTHPEFEYEYANVSEPETLPEVKQKLTIALDKRRFDGVVVTRITGFVGKRIDLIQITQQLQQVCKTGGSSMMYDIVLFRDVRKRAYIYLRNQGFGVQFADS